MSAANSGVAGTPAYRISLLQHRALEEEVRSVDIDRADLAEEVSGVECKRLAGVGEELSAQEVSINALRREREDGAL